jgi:8-oxo-dGTP pyrophosphatase MutT (NUDIX family)
MKSTSFPLARAPRRSAIIGAVLTIDSFRTALGDFKPRILPDEEGQTRAAVAAVLRPGSDGVELLFIHRADDPDDPWSGHMAFPGGRVDPGDADPLAAAMRETREEVGLDLEVVAEQTGRLSDVAAIGRGRPMSMVISPFIFFVESSPPLVPNYEVAEVLWVPANFIVDHSNRETMSYKHGDLSLELPCYRYRGHLIWGMTLGMVDELLSLVAGGDD